MLLPSFQILNLIFLTFSRSYRCFRNSRCCEVFGDLHFSRSGKRHPEKVLLYMWHFKFLLSLYRDSLKSNELHLWDDWTCISLVCKCGILFSFLYVNSSAFILVVNTLNFFLMGVYGGYPSWQSACCEAWDLSSIPAST